MWNRAVGRTIGIGRTSRAGRWFTYGPALALLIALAGAPGCDDAVNDEFRDAAIGQIETGVRAILNGVLTGIFTVAEPSPGETDGTSGGTDTGGGGESGGDTGGDTSGTGATGTSG